MYLIFHRSRSHLGELTHAIFAQYNGSQKVIHNGHLFTAKTVTSGSTPGTASSDWTDNGVCDSFNAPIPTQTSAAESALSPAPSPTQ